MSLSYFKKKKYFLGLENIFLTIFVEAGMCVLKNLGVNKPLFSRKSGLSLHKINHLYQLVLVILYNVNICPLAGQSMGSWESLSCLRHLFKAALPWIAGQRQSAQLLIS